MTIEEEITINDRRVSKGTELSIRGARGRFRFVKYVENNGASWIDVWGGPKGHEQLRSFRIEQVKTVHRVATTPENLLAERKGAKR